MLALQAQNKKTEDSVLNILPCRLHRNGPAKVTKRFWSPTHENDDTKTSYFRGRKLRGKTIKLPPGYTGVAAKATKRLLPEQSRYSSDRDLAQGSTGDAEDEGPDDEPEAVKILQSTATFKQVTVWGHDMLPVADDPFAKGIEEWIAFAEAIHVQPDGSKPRNGKTAGEECDH